MLLVGFIFSSVSVAVIGSTSSMGLALAAQFISGLMIPFIHIACQTLVMSHAEEDFIGRVNGIMNPHFTGGMVLNMSIVGVLKANLPLTALYWIAAVLFLIGAIGVLPLLRHKASTRIAASAAGFHH